MINFSRNEKLKFARLVLKSGLCAGLPIIMSGCTTYKKMARPLATDPIIGSTLAQQVERPPSTARPNYSDEAMSSSSAAQSGTTIEMNYVPSIASANPQYEGVMDTSPPPLKVKYVEAKVAPMPLPDFIDTVFDGMLKVPYVKGPQIDKRSEMVSLRSSGRMKASAFLDLVTIALEEYGVAISPQDGVYRVVEKQSLLAQMPRFIKSRARASTPSSLRPVVQFVELHALDAAMVVGILRDSFGGKDGRLETNVDRLNNFVIMTGFPKDVNQALDVIAQLDDLNYAGAQVRRYTPKYWDVDELTGALDMALRREGWQVATDINQSRTISLMPVPYSNDLFVFAKTAAGHQSAERWILELDRPVLGGDAEQIFVYQVRNVDAQILSETANMVLSQKGGGLMASLRSGNSVAGGGPAAALPANTQQGALQGTPQRGGAVGAFTVDTIGNRIIYTATANDNDKLDSLLRRLDTPAPEVLIEVKVAEVTLTDETSYGVEFFIDDLGGSDVQITGQTGGLGLGSSGATFAVLSGNIDAVINAFASNRQVKVLSTPTMVARSGGSASMQVGQDVPIITSQRAANNQDGTGATDILQGIDYRKTGVLMQIEPIVFSNDRIDLTITQEVSSTLATANSGISSPTISNRSMSTQLSLEDGQTAVMGGLIQEDVVRDEKGVPILKDIPLLGAAFSSDSLSNTRTELVVLITAYVMRGQEDRSRFVRHMSDSVDILTQDEGRLLTLLPRQF